MNQGKNQTGNIMQKDGCEENELNEYKRGPVACEKVMGLFGFVTGPTITNFIFGC